MEKKILSNSGRIYSQHGTSKYRVRWQGDWSEEDLINYCDGGAYNYGGRIENEQEISKGVWEGIVCVYYD